ncbi:hypothetical protein Sipo8835_10450 [Streptomyces ipomoeae]|jgi:hypothetical protein|uniref:Uncharacterized protein n=1 Tax=Streptomyces ipomoeae TaxID=103232 RepID=A0AAE8W4D7_9ACTN|nr:hypothetical protein [Streptomyces ipomoeae]MDX2820661.1 hypothetical protein [Streptomyces ipomoeae]MDX2838670.1 hypothetical protein [Streptomyces ipomoeae]MDX2873169.1 hypothetical protein [Streptomyces ipomoeae]TQE32409.1 hypothetical protein Sipo7851_23835 [Streptomyces ipomoeae]TQE36386.1 hypothetical protein Sipo8835_10450 [Streptomyces ipomoeae]
MQAERLRLRLGLPLRPTPDRATWYAGGDDGLITCEIPVRETLVVEHLDVGPDAEAGHTADVQKVAGTRFPRMP